MPRVNVLDAGYVELVDHKGSDAAVLNAARVSYDNESKTGQDPAADSKLLRYLLANDHTSPFEHVVFTFEVKAPILVFRQWHRHRTWSYSEVSARYTELDMGYYVPDVAQITTQSASNKQMRTAEQHPDAAELRAIIDRACRESDIVYRHLLAQGCPRELARGVLPVNTYSRMAATVDLHNLLGFLRLRLHAHAQYEIRVYAEAMLKLIEPVVPVTVRHWRELKAV